MIIIGKIGSGKTSLLQAILNEMTYIPQCEIDRQSSTDLTAEEQKQLRLNIYGSNTDMKPTI